MKFELKTFVSKLNPTCRKALEAAAVLCVSRSKYNVELEHLLLKLLEFPDTDLERLLHYYEVDLGELKKDLGKTIERFKQGNDRPPTLSPQIIDLFQEAWLLSTLHLGENYIRSGTLLWAALESETTSQVLEKSCPSLLAIPHETMRENIWEIIRVSNESDDSRPDVSIPRQTRTDHLASLNPETLDLDRYTLNLSQAAETGKIDPIRGREPEIRQIIDILMRRRQNNPILTGEAGVGKTAVVEGFALKVAQGEVPEALKSVSVRVLDLGLLQAGAGIRGEFEERLKSVIADIQKVPHPVVMFIDEAHTLIGAGAQSGQGDAANLLKPALARGELRTIAATTWSEYKKYFEKDSALVRRFQVVAIEEPVETSAVDMLRGLVPNLEKHHSVRILDSALKASVHLSARYITERHLPDKAISVLDTACARVAIAQTTQPEILENVKQHTNRLQLEIQNLKREQHLISNTKDNIDELQQTLQQLGLEQKELEKQWQQEQELVQKIQKQEKALQPTQGSPHSDSANKAQKNYRQSLKELAKIQGAQAMIPLSVDEKVIASVISDWTGIPQGKMMTNEIDVVLQLQERMSQALVGQTFGLENICRRIQTSWASLADPERPVGVFLLVGSSGVGKTATAALLAELLYGGERNLIALNMSEYQEAHTVSALKGSPPGYVGYGQGGVLTETVRRKPYSVILLDEVDKAHPDVMDLFESVFDKGKMEDAEGITVDFKNTVIFLTSSIGSESIDGHLPPVQSWEEWEALAHSITPQLLQTFKASLLARVAVVPFVPLGSKELEKIVQLKLKKIQQRFSESHCAKFSYDDTLITEIVEHCVNRQQGARTIDYLLDHSLLPMLASKILNSLAHGASATDLHVSSLTINE